MRVACLMMQKNEGILLSPWVEFHGNLFGFENIYIYDNGSNDSEIPELLENYRLKGVNIDITRSERIDFDRKGAIIADKIKKLDQEGKYDFYFPLDCDEFVGFCPDEGNFGDVSGMLEYLESLKLSQTALSVEGCYFNIPYREDCYYFYPAKKTFFARDSIGWLDEGYHVGTSRFNEDRISTKIFYFHFHNRPFEMLVKHAKLKLDGRVKSFSDNDLRDFNGPGQHLIRYLFTTKNDYKASFPSGERCMHLPFIRRYLLDAKAVIPF